MNFWYETAATGTGLFAIQVQDCLLFRYRTVCYLGTGLFAI